MKQLKPIREFAQEKIDSLIIQQEYKKLSFQREYIIDTVEFFCWSFLMKPIALRYFCNDVFEISHIQYFFENLLGKFNPNNVFLEHIVRKDGDRTEKFIAYTIENILNTNFPVLSMDVGIGKTLMGLVSFEIALSYFKQLLNYNKPLNVGIVIPEILIQHYEETLQKLSLNKKENWNFITDFNNLFNQELIDKEKITTHFIQSLHIHINTLFNGFYKDEFVSNIPEKEIKLAFKLPKYSFLPFLLIDEFTSPVNSFFKPIHIKNEEELSGMELHPSLFDAQKENKEKISFPSIFGLGLSASKTNMLYVNSPYYIGVYGNITPVLSKYLSKEEIAKEIIEKGIYIEKDFDICHISGNSGYIKEYWEKLKTLKATMTNVLGEEKKLFTGVEDFFNKLSDFNKDIHSLSHLKEHIIKLLYAKKTIVEANKQVKIIKKKLEKLQINFNKIKLELFYKDPITLIKKIGFETFLDKRTLIILDENWEDSAIENLKSYFQELNFKQLTKENTNIEEKGVLIGKIYDIGRGYNFQTFDSLVMMYTSDLSLEDLHQILGRIDRIQNDGLLNKKQYLYLYSFLQEENIEQLIKNRKNNANETKILDFAFATKYPKEILKQRGLEKQLLESKNTILEKIDFYTNKTALQESSSNDEKDFVLNIATSINEKILAYFAMTGDSKSPGRGNVNFSYLLNSNSKKFTHFFTFIENLLKDTLEYIILLEQENIFEK